MATVIYLQCPTGIAGDMCLGALVDLGVPLDYLSHSLQSLGLQDEFTLRSQEVQRQTQRGIKVHVDIHNHHHHDHHHHRHLPEIERLIHHGLLPERVKQWSKDIFKRLAIAEGAVHGEPPEQVHFHEVGATDALVDIVGTCLGLDYLNVEEVYCSALPTGGGTVKAAHGRMAVPVPAVLKLWEGRHVPIYDNGIEKELVTPTGVAIVCTLAHQFGPMPRFQVEKTGWGAGSLDLAVPNLLRMVMGQKTSSQPQTETIVVLETQIDDLSPQAIAYTYDLLFEAGAMDVFTQPVTMKKSRLGVLLTVICHESQRSQCEQIIFRETSTLGIRSRTEERTLLKREIIQVQTPYGPIDLKLGYLQNQVVNAQPEFEQCAAIARQFDLPWQTIHQAALQGFSSNHQTDVRS
jgi:uncharacterized protein (TIGR00299 family) protein